MSPPQHGPVFRWRTSGTANDVHVRVCEAGHPTAMGQVRTPPRRPEAGG